MSLIYSEVAYLLQLFIVKIENCCIVDKEFVEHFLI